MENPFFITNYSEQTDLELIQASLKGNKQALEMLILRHQPVHLQRCAENDDESAGSGRCYAGSVAQSDYKSLTVSGEECISYLAL